MAFPCCALKAVVFQLNDNVCSELLLLDWLVPIYGVFQVERLCLSVCSLGSTISKRPFDALVNR